MTVAELIEQLKNYPADTRVESVIAYVDYSDYNGQSISAYLDSLDTGDMHYDKFKGRLLIGNDGTDGL